jgi:hypothetical protein
MIDLQLVQSNRNSLFEHFISSPIETERFSISKNRKNKYRFVDKSKNVGNIYNEDDVEFTEYFYRRLLGINFDSILISGLGLGIVPFICQNTTNIVDVVEIDAEIISFVSGIGHLNSNVNIINSDINHFTPSRKYDVIVFDHMSMGATELQKQIFISKFQPHLNINGIITIPIIEQFSNTN